MLDNQVLKISTFLCRRRRVPLAVFMHKHRGKIELMVVITAGTVLIKV